MTEPTTPAARLAAALARAARFGCPHCAYTWWQAPLPDPWPWPAQTCPQCGQRDCLGEIPNEDVPALVTLGGTLLALVERLIDDGHHARGCNWETGGKCDCGWAAAVAEARAVRAGTAGGA